ncbi:MAG: DUF2059 domain-containing protein [Acidiferrobacteraceae bacterium]
MASRWALMLVVACAFAPSRGFADAMTPEKRAAIEQLLKMANAKAMGLQMAAIFIAGMERQVHALRPDIPRRADDIVVQEVTRVMRSHMSGLINQIVPLYGKYYTLSDIRSMIAFYKTPVGQKILRVTPLLTRDSALVGERWGQSLGPLLARRVVMRLQQSNLLPPPSPKGAVPSGSP